MEVLLVIAILALIRVVDRLLDEVLKVRRDGPSAS